LVYFVENDVVCQHDNFILEFKYDGYGKERAAWFSFVESWFPFGHVAYNTQRLGV
jgi:hypothetical protein